MKSRIWSFGFVALLLLTLVGVASAETGSAWLTAPSAAPYGKTIDIRGGGLTPDAVLTLKIVGPDALETLINVTPDADGNLQTSYNSPLGGKHVAGLYDADDKLVISVSFGFSSPE